MSELEKALQALTQDLYYISESDYPVDPLFWSAEEAGEAPLSDAFLRAQAGMDSEALVSRSSFAAFFAPLTEAQDWHGEAEQEEVRRYAAISALLSQNLSDLCVYRVGETEKAIFVAGRAADGSLWGVQTRAIET